MRTALLLLAALPLAACAIGDPCEDTEAGRARSPDGKRDAVLFDRNCGATTGFSTQISILPAGASPSGKGNAFIADGAAAASWGGPWAAMRWLGPDRLEIAYDSKARVFLQQGSAGGAKVAFRPASPPAGAVTP